MDRNAVDEWCLAGRARAHQPNFFFFVCYTHIVMENIYVLTLALRTVILLTPLRFRFFSPLQFLVVVSLSQSRRSFFPFSSLSLSFWLTGFFCFWGARSICMKCRLSNFGCVYVFSLILFSLWQIAFLKRFSLTSIFREMRSFNI